LIVQLTGTLVEVMPTHVVLEVGGIGYEMGVSSVTAASLPAVGEPGVTLLTRLVVREDALTLFGFSSREERALFDRLTAISGVGPKLALAVLSTYSPSDLAGVVAAKDASRMAAVPGVGKKKADRLLLELEGVFAHDMDLAGLVGAAPSAHVAAVAASPEARLAEARSALLAMGFTPQEAELALEGAEEAGAHDTKAMITYALRRLGGGA
jgi:Holliday junction DNA helicase RuvA